LKDTLQLWSVAERRQQTTTSTIWSIRYEWE